MSLATLENRLDHHFSDPALLEQALTHRSHGARHNERLEFLGDSVLNFVVAAMLFERFAKIDEGDLSRLRPIWSSRRRWPTSRRNWSCRSICDWAR